MEMFNIITILKYCTELFCGEGGWDGRGEWSLNCGVSSGI